MKDKKKIDIQLHTYQTAEKQRSRAYHAKWVSVLFRGCLALSLMVLCLFLPVSAFAQAGHVTETTRSDVSLTSVNDIKKMTYLVVTLSFAELKVEDLPADAEGQAYTVINDNVPFFTADDLTTEAFEYYSPRDSYGRCGMAFANICQEIMPTEPRGEIGSVKPSGWHTIKYDFLPDRYLYNRCHLIAYQLAGENANDCNLITGTRYFNVQGMEPFENEVADYVKRTDHHVLYRVTPIYEGDELVARGVLMEAASVEDQGAGLHFNVFVYNKQPGVIINYANGDSEAEDTADVPLTEETEAKAQPEAGSDTAGCNYILNTNTHKFHLPDCKGTKTMKDKNKIEFDGSREEAISQGYDPCKMCYP